MIEVLVFFLIDFRVSGFSEASSKLLLLNYFPSEISFILLDLVMSSGNYNFVYSCPKFFSYFEVLSCFA